MISANDLTPAELAALLHFHVEAGVEWLLEEEAVDRFAEFEAMKATRQGARAVQPRVEVAPPATAAGSAAGTSSGGTADRLCDAAAKRTGHP